MKANKTFHICTVGEIPGQIRRLRLAENGDDYGEGEPRQFPASTPAPEPKKEDTQ